MDHLLSHCEVARIMWDDTLNMTRLALIMLKRVLGHFGVLEKTSAQPPNFPYMENDFFVSYVMHLDGEMVSALKIGNIP